MDENEPNVVNCKTSKRKSRQKIVWTNDMVKIFLEECLSEVAKGNRPGTHFNKVGWANLKQSMTKRTQREFDPKQLRNKWDLLKIDWKRYDRLTRIEIGLGAIDGTHIRTIVPQKEAAKYIGRKGHTTQNIMAACDFNMCFTFVWAGWEGTTDDTRIFNEALRRPEIQYPHPAGDKYYVVDAGYPNTRGYLAPYKCTHIRYHIPDFRRGQTSAMRAPRGGKEVFNYLTHL